MNKKELKRGLSLIKSLEKNDARIKEIERAAEQISQIDKSVTISISYKSQYIEDSVNQKKAIEELSIPRLKKYNTFFDHWMTHGSGSGRIFNADNISFKNDKDHLSSAQFSTKMKDTEALEVFGVLLARRMRERESILHELEKLGVEL